ncbi:MAG: ABC transporter permease [Proteobacteria bacterium]|nr:ABC transporter permease [Pseudomonadota bacterium]
MSLELFNYFFKREIKDKYLGNLTGFAWVFIQPILMLLIYWFVFDKIFKARFSEEEQDVGFIVYLAVGLWPWVAFSESIIRSITAVSDKSDLIGKIKIDLKTPVVAAISATFFLNMLGYVFVLVSLVVLNDGFSYKTILLVIFPLIQMFCLALALGLFLSSLQVFIRDTLQIMTTLMTMWFFLTPIIYSVAFLPEKFKSIIQINPLYIPISFIHKALITKEELPWLNLSVLTLITVVLLFFSIKLFDRLSPNFVDYK